MSNESGSESAPPPAATLHLWQIQGVRDVLVLLVVFALVAVGYWLRDVTVPLLIALALAYLFEPLVQRLTRFRGITRTGAVTIILLTVGVSVTIAITLTAPFAIGQTVSLVNKIRTSDYSSIGRKVIEYLPEQYRDDLRPAVEWLSQGNAKDPIDPELPGVAASPSEPKVTTKEIDATPSDGDALPAEAAAAAARAREDERVRSLVRAELEAMGYAAGHGLGDIGDGHDPAGSVAVAPAVGEGSSGAPWRVLGALGSTAERVGALFLALVQYSLILFLIPFYFWFFSVSFPKLLEFGRSLIPKKNREQTLYLIGLMDRAVSGFVRGRIVISVIMGLLFAIGWVICGVPYAITLGLFVGAISLVPYLGGVGVPLAVGLLFFDQLHLAPEARMAWWGVFLWPTLVFVIVQSFEGYVLTPLIAGKATDLDPVTIVVAIIAGGSVAGVYGMLLAIPFAACGKILITHLVLPSVRAWSRGEAADPLPIESLPNSGTE
jgi:predicted PurR-regulated permease PerM